MQPLIALNRYAPGIGVFCSNRWTVGRNFVGSILENYKVLQQLWEECLEAKLELNIKG